MGTTEKYSRYRWKEGREKDLWSFVDEKVRDGSSVTAALKEYGKKNEMSWLTARWKYYQIKKRDMAEKKPGVPDAKPQGGSGGPFTAAEEDFLGYLAEIVTSSRDLGQDVVPFIKGLSRMATLSRESTLLKEERERRRAAAREDIEALADTCRFIEEWLQLSQVDRVASLKAFSERMSGELATLTGVRSRLEGS